MYVRGRAGDRDEHRLFVTGCRHVRGRAERAGEGGREEEAQLTRSKVERVDPREPRVSIS